MSGALQFLPEAMVRCRCGAIRHANKQGLVYCPQCKVFYQVTVEQMEKAKSEVRDE